MSHCERMKRTCKQTQRGMLDAISEPDAMLVKTLDLSLNTFTVGLTCDLADSQSSH